MHSGAPQYVDMAVEIILADDHEIVREGFRALLERHGFRVVGEASDGQEAVRLAQKLQPQIAVLDLSMPLLSGIEASRQITSLAPGTKTILLTMYMEDQYILEALKAGASGYILKTKGTKELVDAICQVLRGTTYLSPEVSRAVIEAYRGAVPPDIAPISPRERQVLQLVAEGKSTKEAASVLGISVKTASAHRTNLMSKLDIHETAGLVRFAIRLGLVRP
jgi:two-component system, NarL family, response regulator NreC